MKRGASGRRPARTDPAKQYRLRRTLTGAFLLLALLGGACGAVGLVYVSRINATVSVFADLTSPMLTTTTELVEDALRYRSSLSTAWQRQVAPDQLRAQVEEFHASAMGKIATLRSGFQEMGIEIALERAIALEEELIGAVARTIDSYQVQRAAAQLLKSAAQETGRMMAIAEGSLQLIITTAEAEIVALEEQTKIGVQTGSVSVEALGQTLARFFNLTYQILEKSRWISRTLEHFEETGAVLHAHPREKDLAAVAGKSVRHFAIIDALMAHLRGRLVVAGRAEQFDPLREALNRLKALMMGPQGMLASARKAMAAQHAMALEGRKAAELETVYFALLEEVREAVATINADAKRSAESTIADARLVVAASLALALLVALLLGAFLSRRITWPLSRLTMHAVAIGETGKLEPMPTCDISRNRDEIATLALAFNRMIDELAEARSQLIAQSQEEVRVQYGRLSAAVTNMPQGLAMFDKDRRLVVCNERYSELYELPRDVIHAGTSYERLVRIAFERCTPEFLAAQGGDIGELVSGAVETFYSRRYSVRELRHGRTVAVRHTPMDDGGVVATHEDITERRRTEAKIAHMAMHDMLTDLANRTAFVESLSESLARVQRGEEMAVLYFDLDHFKHVNDSLGHPVGDALLRCVADRLRACVRETDTVARLGGDEFAIVQASLGQPRGAAELAARLVAEISRPYEIAGHTVVIGASVGVALAPGDGTDADTLLRNADMALYRSKAEGRGTYSFFEPAMDAKMQARRALELQLRRANALNEFELYYQPLVATKSGRVSGCEALLRWNHPTRGVVPTSEFIPIAEEIGLFAELGERILLEACKAAAAWPPDLTIAVNLSPSQFTAGRILRDVKHALARSGLEPHRLELEITENLLLKDPDSIIAGLYELRTLGVRVAIDDYGTGHSSLGYLRRFRFDRIKIDQSFVHDLPGRRDAVAIVRAVNGLAAALGIETVAEGVETDEQLAEARSEGCSAIQGKFFSAPVPLCEVDALFSRQLEPDRRRTQRNAA